MDKSKLIAFKGMVDGVRINISDDGRVFEIVDELEKKIIENKAFFGDGDCRISFGGRRLSDGEKQKLRDLVVGLLPLSRVDFDREPKKEIPPSDWISEYKERSAKGLDEVETEEEKPKPEADSDEFVSVFRSNRARFYEGTVKKDMTLRSDGHLILLGKVESGGELIATGNIVVMGGLYGTAHAGCNGHNGSYIIAMDMHPEGLAISRTAERYEYQTDEATEQVTEEAKKSFFDKFKKHDKEEQAPEPAEKEFPALATLKNNKIELDKFLIQDFTNLKNMI